MCEAKSVCVWGGGGDPLSPLLPEKWGGALFPLFLRLWRIESASPVLREPRTREFATLQSSIIAASARKHCKEMDRLCFVRNRTHKTYTAKFFPTSDCH